MRSVANKHPELFFSAVVKLIPRELHTHLSNETNINAAFHTVSEVKRALEAEGFNSDAIRQLESMLPMPVHDDEPLDAHDEEAA